MKLKKGDKVIITTGKDKGKTGKVEKIFPKINKVLLPGLNVYKRHLKKRDEKHPGGIIDISHPLPVSNVMLICPKCGKTTRIGYKTGNKTKERICKKCSANI
jgi:large subunit ribosomal protein L24